MPLLDDYTTPPFPALYWPISVLPGEPQYLHSVKDAWRFTFFWTLIVFEVCHLVASGYALVVQWRNWKVMIGVMIVYTLLAGIEALMAGSIIGLLYVLLISDSTSPAQEHSQLTGARNRLGTVYKVIQSHGGADPFNQRTLSSAIRKPAALSWVTNALEV
ncbi:MAG: hypothetical protein Q9224_000544 [Gallowayella concinna]